jgi:hypothetical protein
MRQTLQSCVFAVLGAMILAPVQARAQEDEAFTTDFRIEDCTWAHNSQQNPFMRLTPGWRLVLAGEEDGEDVDLQITVLRAKQRVVFTTPAGKRVSVLTRIVEERESVGGELAEVSRNFFALCRETGNAFYFGEVVDIYEDGEIVDHSGGWRAGRNGAQPGVIMPGSFMLGARYFQEQAPGVALDRAQNVAMGETVETEAGTFHGCVRVEETNALHPDEEGEEKVHCPGVGQVTDEDLELVEFGFVPPGQE